MISFKFRLTQCNSRMRTYLTVGLAMGVRKGLGAAVGGVFGTAGKITGAAGKAFAILSLDEEYQRKRRQQQQRPPADLQVLMA